MASLSSSRRPGAVRVRVPIYQDKLGQVLRSAGRTEFGPTFDSVPLNLVIEVPAKVAADLAKDGLMQQQILLDIRPVMQRHVATYVAPFLTPNVPANVAALEATLAARSQDFARLVDGIIERHYRSIGAWESLRRENLIEGLVTGVTLTLSVVGFGLAPATAGVSGAAAIIGIVRGVIDGIAQLRGHWLTAVEALVAVEQDIRRLNRYHDTTGAVGAGAAQVAGGVLRTAGVTKVVSVVSGMFGKNGDPLPSIGSIEKGLSVAERKIGHLYCFLNRMTEKLSQLLLEQELGNGAEAQRLEQTIAALLSDGQTGKRHGFRHSYTIADGLQQCKASSALVADYKRQISALRARDPNAKLTGAAVLAGEVVTNAGFVAMNRPQMFTGGSAAEIFGITGSVRETINSSFGMFNDAVGTLKDLAGVWGAASGDSDVARQAEAETRLAFTTSASSLVPSGSNPGAITSGHARPPGA